MKQSLLNSALAIILNRKHLAETQAQEALSGAFKNAEFKTAYQALQQAIQNQAKDQAYGIKNDGSEVKKCQKEYENVKNKLKIGSISPNYHCKKCGDRGIVNGEYCTCLKKEIALLLIKNSGFDSLEDFSHSNFSIFEDQEKAKKIYALMQKWCTCQTNKTLVYLFGQTGTGKTHLMKCMAKSLIDEGKICQLLSAFALNQKFLQIHTSSEETKAQLLDDLLSVEVLFIDDLGTEPVYKNVTREYLYLLINERQARNLRTVITSNLDPEQIMSRYDERIFSRIINKDKSICLEISGKDLRVKKKA